MSIQEFWELSPMELNDCIQSYKRRRENEIKQQVNMNFLLAEVISRRIFAEKEDEIPQPWDYYPELFEMEKQISDEAYRKKKIEEYKEQRRKYVEEFNRRRH